MVSWAGQRALATGPAARIWRRIPRAAGSSQTQISPVQRRATRTQPVPARPGRRTRWPAGPVADTWATATAPGEPADGGTSDEIGTSGSSSFDGPEGRDHGPSDRG